MKGYAAIAFFICTWWMVAFWPREEAIKACSRPTLCGPHSPLYDYLSPLSRDHLKEALQGNFLLMADLMRQWEVDAELLTSHGVSLKQALTRSERLRAQLLARRLTLATSEELTSHTACDRLPYVRDDVGTLFSLRYPFVRFLPQTYVSGGIGLTLCPITSLVAIHRGLWNQPQLYPPHRLQQIPMTIDRLDGEALFQNRPDVAFVALYSNPHALQTLRNQQIPLFFANKIGSLQDIFQTIQTLGHVYNRPQEAELLVLFARAAFEALDARVQLAHPQKMLYVTYRERFFLPGNQSVTYELLQRLGLNSALSSSLEGVWRLPIDREQIVTWGPEKLIVSSPQHSQNAEQLKHDPAFRGKEIRVIDEDVQETPNHFVVLAYFDLVNAVLGAP